MRMNTLSYLPLLKLSSKTRQCPGNEAVKSSRSEGLGRSVRFPGLLLFILAGISFAPGKAAFAQGTFIFPSVVSVGSASTAQSVPVTIKNGGTLGAIQVLTQGAPNLDFSSSGGTCASGTTYSPGQSCTVSVVLSAKLPGIRTGAVILSDGNGSLMGTEFLSGMASGPLSVMSAGELTTVAGSGHLSSGAATGTKATDASIHEPLGVAIDGAGNFYYTDNGNNLIDKVDPSGNLTVVAGTGAPGFSPSGTTATSASISSPSAIVVDGAGNIFFTELGNSTVREIVNATGLLQTIAGNGTQGYSGDGGAANNALLNQPEGLAIDAAGNIYVADTANNVLRKIDATTGIITTIAGSATAGFAGDGQLATAGQFNEPWGVFAAADGSLYIADYGNNRVRRIDPTGRLSTVAGNGTPGYTGDNAAANVAALNHPVGIALNAASDVFISDSENNVIRKINGTTQVITTFAGNGGAASAGDGTNADTAIAGMNKPYGITLDGSGDLFIADRLGLTIREIFGPTARIMFRDQKATNLSATTVQRVVNGGNAPLHLSAITPVSNAVINAGTTTCSTTAAINPGGACVIGVQFQPATVNMPANTPVTGEIDVLSDSAVTPAKILLFGNSLSIEPTTTKLTSSVNPSAYGQAVVFTATISSLYTGQLRGNVQFVDTSNSNAVIGNAAVNSTTRTATITISNLALGVHQIVATFTDTDTNNTNSTSMPLPQTVQQAAALALSSNLNPARVYDNVTFTVVASETPAGGTAPTGSIAFTDSFAGSALNGTSVPLVNGSASLSTALLAAGPHTITATYAGDTNNSAATSNVLTQIINTALSTTTLTTSNPNVPLNTLVTFTATVAGNTASTPTGNVIFKDGTATLGTVAVTGGGTASFSTSTLSTGTHMITAAYQGDADYAGSISTPALVETVNKIATSTGVVSSANAANAGAAVTFTVTVTAASSTTPNLAITGSVNLMDGTTVVGTGAVSALGSGPATASVVIPVSSLSVGAHTITAVYAGDTNYTGSTSGSVPEVISLATTSTTLTASTTAPVATTPVILTATLTSNGGTPAGSVTFLDGSATIGTGTLAKGVATLTTTTLAVGTHTITAVYGGDANDTASTSNTVTITVSARTTTVTLASSQNPLLTLSPVTITATVATAGGTAPTGTISFTQDGVAVSTATISATGTATLQLASLSAGNHAFVATYSGDAVDMASASAPLSEIVQLRATTDSLTTSATSLTGGQQITLISVLRWNGPVTPTGTVSFLSGTTTLATTPVDASGVATVTVLLSGTSASLSSSYSGDANYATSVSDTDLVTIGPAPDFTLAATPLNFTLVSKEHKSLAVTVTSVRNFTDTLSFGCLGLPQAATCSFSKDQMLIAAGETQSVTLTVDTGNPLLAGAQARNDAPQLFHSDGSKLALACSLPGAVLLGLFGMRFRRLRNFRGLLLLCLAGLSAGLTGCGMVNMTGTPAGTYTFNVSVVGKTGVSESIPITMVVTQ